MNLDMDRPGARHGCRFVAALASTLLAFLGVFGAPEPARAGTVSARVEARAAATDGAVPVIIRLHSVAPRTGSSRASIVRMLRDDAARSQTAVLAGLRGPAKRFWLVNAIATEVDGTELATLRADPTVASVELDEQVTITRLRQVDGPPSSSWGVDSVNAPTAWSSYGVTGAGVRIGSIDTGVDGSNAELAGAIVGWRDFVAGRPDPYDDNGHGTHTIGTMVARNARVRIGLAPGASVVVAKAIGADGAANGSALLEAAQWMTDPDGNPATADHPTIINNSWTAPGWDNEWFRPMVQAWVAMGILPVFGVGNTPGTIGNPASYPESLTVGAVDQSGAVAANSSGGLVTWYRDGVASEQIKPDITAPGVMISSTVGNGYGWYTGSSMAAPHVAAAAALLKQARPDLDVAGLREALRLGAVDRGPTGHDLSYGAGTLDVAASLAALGSPQVAAAPTVATAPTAPLAKATSLRLLRVTRTGTRFVVRGRVSGPARLRLTVRPAGKQQNSVSVATVTSARAGGSFVVRSISRRLPKGRYVVSVVALDANGKRVAGAWRYVALR